MAAISELIKEHSKVPGDIRLAHCDCTGWFRPYFLAINDYWHGLNHEGKPSSWPEGLNGFKLYTEPLVKRAQYLLIPPDGGRPFITQELYLADEQIKEDWPNWPNYTVRRLPETEREFDW